MLAQDIVGLMAAHSSCRDYAEEALPDGLLERLVEAAQHASTDATGQLYSVVRVADPGLRQRVAPMAGDQRHVRAAPEFLVVCLDMRRIRRLLEHRGHGLGMRTMVGLLFGVTDAALFAQSLVLAAEAHGLGACYIGAVQNHPGEISALLGLPSGVVPLWGLTLGRPRSRNPPKPRLPTSMVLHTDAYRDAAPDEMDAAYERMATATRSGDWLNAIRKYFAQGGVMEHREPDFRGLLERQGLPL